MLTIFVLGTFSIIKLIKLILLQTLVFFNYYRARKLFTNCFTAVAER